MLVGGNKKANQMQQMVLYCNTYCLLNMFRAPLCPSSGAQEHYAGGRCLWYFVLWLSGCRYGAELEVMCPVCRLLQLELLMMGMVLPETCRACNKICNKYHLLHLVGILFPHNNDDTWSKSLQIFFTSLLHEIELVNRMSDD